jgi:tape measure domain-containing protein
MAEEIGLKAKFDTREFTKGLNIYSDGLKRANRETAALTKSVSAQVDQMQQAWTRASSAPNAVAGALKVLTNSINQYVDSINKSLAANQKMVDTQQKLTSAVLKTTTRLNSVSNAMNNASNSANRGSSSIRGMSAASLALAAAAGTAVVLAMRRIGQAIAGVVKEGVGLVVFFERLDLSIQFFTARSLRSADATLTFADALSQGRERAQDLTEWVTRLSILSPFTPRQVGAVFRVSQAYGLLAEEAETLLPLLLDLGAATGLEPETLENAARAIGQIRARGKLTGEEVRQLGNAGIPIRDILVKQLGFANEEFEDLVKSGSLTANTVIPALIASLEDFAGAGQKVALETLGGLLSTLEGVRQVSFAKFFKGFFEPLQEGLAELTKGLLDSDLLPTLQALGQILGTQVAKGIEAARTAIGNFVQALATIDKETLIMIVAFTAAFSATLVLAGGIAVLAIALNLLLNPVVLAAVAVATLATVWVSNFDKINSAFQTLLDGLEKIEDGIADFVTSGADLLSGFVDFVNDIFDGMIQGLDGLFNGVLDSFADGILSSFPAISGAIKAIGALFDFWLKPGSDSRAVKGETYGYGNMGAFFDGAERSVRENARKIGPILQGELGRSFGAQDELAKEGARLGNETGEEFFGALSLAMEPTQDLLFSAVLKASQEAENAAGDSGEAVGSMFWEGVVDSFPEGERIVNNEIEAIFAKIGQGRQLSISGALAISRFTDGFEKADFSALNQISGTLGKRLADFVKIGEVDELALPVILNNINDALAESVAEFRAVGKVSQETIRSIGDAAGPAGRDIEVFADKYFTLAVAANESEAAQKNLNDVTQKYSELLEPLNERLAKFRDIESSAKETREIAALQRLVNNQGVTDARRREASAKIQAIRATQQIRTIEIKRKAEEGEAKDRLDAAKTIEDKSKEELDLFRARLDLQNKQISLVAQEASLIEKLTAQLEKLQEKEISTLERQLKFAQLLRQEEADRLNEARARFTLNDGEATAFEKQQALLQLQTIELNKQNREIEARELGFGTSELETIRNSVITLDDLNIKSKEGFDAAGEGLGKLAGAADKMKGLSKEFNDSLKDARDNIQAIIDRWNALVDTVNARLPDFLKIRGESGEQAPILGFLGSLFKNVVAIGVAFKVLKIVAKITSMGSAAGASATQVATLTPAIAGLAGPLTTVSIALFLYETNLLGSRDALIDWHSRNLILVDGVKSVWASFSDFMQNKVFNPLLVGFSDLGVALGLSESSEEAQKSIQKTFDNTGELLKTLLLGPEDGAGIPVVWNIIPKFLEDQKKTGEEVGTELTDGLSEGANKGYDEFIAPYRQRVLDSLSNVGGTGEQAGIDISEGIIKGLLNQDKTAIDSAAQETADQILKSLETATEIESPSELTAREIGEPLAQGIYDGINRYVSGASVKEFVDGTVDRLKSLKSLAAPVLSSFNTFLKTKNDILQRALLRDVSSTNNAVVTAFKEFTDKLSEQFNGLLSTISNSVITLASTISGSFNGVFRAVETSGVEFGNFIIGLWGEIRDNSLPQITSMSTELLNALSQGPQSLFGRLSALFAGTEGEGGIGENVALGLLGGIGRGIADETAFNTLVSPAIKTFAERTKAAFDAEFVMGSPSLLMAQEVGLPISEGVALGITQGAGTIASAVNRTVSSAIAASVESRFASASGLAGPSSVSNVSRTNNFNLNVSSTQRSQGTISDFEIMRVMAFDE